MKVYTLKRKQKVKRPLKEVFNFFDRPENLSKLTPDALGFKILTPPPIVMKEGALIDYTVKVMGINIHWRTLISTYDPPDKFVDEQLKGPYSFWHHTHRFKEIPEGTSIEDEVHYALPFGIIGRLVHSLFVKRQLKKIFDYRSRTIAGIFEASKPENGK